MNYPADSTAKLCQGGKSGKSQRVGREGIPIDNCSAEKCEPVIVFESLDLSVSQRVYVSRGMDHSYLLFSALNFVPRAVNS